MWELDYKESWAPKNWCFWTVVLEKTLESPLDSKEIQPVHPKGNGSWIFFGRTDGEAEAQHQFGYLMWRTDLMEKPLMLGRLKAGGEGDNRGWDSWMASLTQWTWVWVNCRSWWWTGKPGMLQSMGLQSQTRLSDWTELNGGKLNSLPLSSWTSIECPFSPLLLKIPSQWKNAVRNKRYTD